MSILRVAVIALALPVVAYAKPITLKCTTSKGEPAADLEAGHMKWGTTNYTIINKSDRYISAYLNTQPDEIGGEIWVLDRISGSYKRASVAMLMKGEEYSPESAVLEATTYYGRCNAPQL